MPLKVSSVSEEPALGEGLSLSLGLLSVLEKDTECNTPLCFASYYSLLSMYASFPENAILSFARSVLEKRSLRLGGSLVIDCFVDNCHKFEKLELI